MLFINLECCQISRLTILISKEIKKYVDLKFVSQSWKYKSTTHCWVILSTNKTNKDTQISLVSDHKITIITTSMLNMKESNHKQSNNKP